MGHQRFRKFNTKDMYPDQTIDNDMCMIVKSGRHIFLQGQTGFDLNGAFVGAGDPAAQADQAMKNVKLLLEEAGATLADICKITTYITGRATSCGRLPLRHRADRQRPRAASSPARRSASRGRPR